MIYLILYFMSMLFSYLLLRKVAYKAIEELTDLIILLFLIFVPVINILFSIFIFLEHADIKNKINIKNLIGKIFLIKRDNGNDKFKGKRYN